MTEAEATEPQPTEEAATAAMATDDGEDPASADDTKDVAMTSTEESSSAKSALQENIERKGKNAYYFAHAHKANGPAWDGKAEPKLLARSTSENAGCVPGSSFEYYKSNITSYAFSDEGSMVKLYLSMENVGETCSKEDVTLDFTETSLCLVVNNYKEQPQCLSFGKLTAPITDATFRIKKDRIILSLTKEKEGEWHTINDKGAPDHELL